MIFDNIRRRLSGILLLAVVFLCLLWGNAFFNPPEKIVWHNSLFSGLPESISPQVYVILSLLLTLLCGFLIYKISLDHLSVHKREHLLVWLWVIQIGGFSFLHTLNEVQFAVMFLLMSYNRLFYINRKESDYSGVFLSAMYLGIAAVFYNLTAYLLIPYIFGLYRFKTTGIKDWIVLIAGFLTPFYFAVFISFFINGDWYYPIGNTIQNLIPSLPANPINLTTPQYIFIFFILLLVCINLFSSLKLTSSVSQKTVACNSAFFRLMIFSIILLFLFAPEANNILMVIFITSTTIIRNLFVQINKNWVANLLFLLVIALSALACYLPEI